VLRSFIEEIPGDLASVMKSSIELARAALSPVIKIK